MAENVLMIALSPTMESGTIIHWTKKEGEQVSNGDIICEVETDKDTMEYEAIQEGILLKILVPEGDSADVEQPIAIFGSEGEDITSLVQDAEEMLRAQRRAQPAEAGASTPAATQTEDTPIPDSAAIAGEKSKSSPLARKMAEQAGLEIFPIHGTGPDGRVVKRDVEDAISSGMSLRKPATAAPSPSDAVIPLSGKRKIIAQRLSESKYSAPHFYLKMSVFAESLMAARAALNAGLDYKVSVNAFLIKFAAEAIKRHPVINSTWQNETIRQFASIDIGLAVAQEDGLVTPIVRNCGAKGIVSIDAELSDLISRARKNKLTPEDYTGATFTISSLGTFGVDEFTAIINPPGSAILAVGQMKKVPIVDDNDKIVIRSQMNLTLSCDHRVIDGAKGANFLKELKDVIENPVRALY